MFFFETGLSSIRAASTPNRSQEFQVGYLKCRSDFLQALSQLVYTCHSLRTSPPPAIASSQAKVCTGFFLVKSQRKFVTLCPRCPKIKMNDKKKARRFQFHYLGLLVTCSMLKNVEKSAWTLEIIQFVRVEIKNILTTWI